MDCCDRNMRRVRDSLFRQREGGFQSARQINDFVGKVEKGEPLQSEEALARRLRIARRGKSNIEIGTNLNSEGFGVTTAKPR